MSTSPQIELQRLAKIIADSAAAVLSQITQLAWTATAERSESLVSGAMIAFSIQGSLTGEIAFLVSPQAARQLACTFMGMQNADSTGELTEEDSEAVDELMRQVAGSAATSLRPDFGKLELRFIGRAGVGGGTGWRVELRSGEVSIEFHMSVVANSIAEPTTPPAPASDHHSDNSDLRSDHSPKRFADSSTPIAGSPPRSLFEQRLADRELDAKNIDLLLDIEIAVTLRFGRREMLLKDILELSSGSVIELDRLVSEPVELLVDQKVIARGEVVVIDGNYGLRVTDVANPQQKIECIA